MSDHRLLDVHIRPEDLGEASASSIFGMGTIDSISSVLTQSALDALCEKYHILDNFHPELPAPNSRIRYSPVGEIGLYRISRYYTLDEGCNPTYWDDEDRELDLFAFIYYADPTKVRIGERQVGEGEENQEGKNQEDVVQDEDIDIEDDVDVAAPNPNLSEEDHVVYGSSLPPKRLRGDHNVSGSGRASIDGKSLAAIQELLEQSTLNVVANVMAATTVPFRFVVSSDFTPASNDNVVDDEVTSVVRSAASVFVVLMAATVTTLMADVSLLVPRTDPKLVAAQVHAYVFASPTSPLVARADIAGPSHIVHSEHSSGSFFVSQDMDPRTFKQIYIPKWDVVNDSRLEDPDVCRSFNNHLAPPGFFSQLWSMDYDRLLAKFNVGAAHQSCFNAEIRMRLEHELRGRHREAEAAKAIRLRAEASNFKAIQRSLQDEVQALKEHNAIQEREKIGLDVKVADLVTESQACEPGLRNEVSGYKLFKERVEAMQDEQIKALSDRVAGMDADLIDLALHMDEEFYPRFLTTISE
ncbi:hypothetical protein Tco_0661957 [Tanacetum coccineum]